MSNPTQQADEYGWSCVKCAAAIQVSQGANYHRCPACGELLKLAWHGTRLDVQATRLLRKEILDAKLTSTDLKNIIVNTRLRMRELNDKARQLEMAKGNERLQVLAVFVIICAIIYSIFLVTVTGVLTLLNPGPVEISFGSAALVSLLVLILFRLKKGGVVRRVQGVITERESAEMEMESARAALELRYGVSDETASPREPPKQKTQPDPAPELEDTDRRSDILGKFASRQKGKRKRLSLRDQSD